VEDGDRRKESSCVTALHTTYFQHPALSDTAVIDRGCQEENESPSGSKRIDPDGSWVSRASVDEDRIAGLWRVFAPVRMNNLHMGEVSEVLAGASGEVGIDFDPDDAASRSDDLGMIAV